jgi:hypothetical protein
MPFGAGFVLAFVVLPTLLSCDVQDDVLTVVLSVPGFFATEDVERVIGSCTGLAFALQDRAVLLLLARLGLRASEVAGLKFADIDWRNGEITLCGRGRRQESLPQEVGNAILLYLNQGRPSLKVPEVFTTVNAPLHALTWPIQGTGRSDCFNVRVGIMRSQTSLDMQARVILRRCCFA